MFKTLYLGSLYGTKIFIHWSFWILAILIFMTQLPNGLTRALALLGFVFAVFACVFLHELGHALAARSFGRKTLDITLLPIGGVARIEGGQIDPWPDGWIAAAGPAVNFLIAFLLWAGVSIAAVFRMDFAWGDFPWIDFKQLPEWTWAKQLLVANLLLAFFNLIPAFPLDGGRIFRSLLCFRVSRQNAIEISSRVGQWIAGMWILYSLIQFDLLGVFFGIAIFAINAAQRLQSQWIVVGQDGVFRGTSPMGWPGAPFNETDSFGNTSSFGNTGSFGDTIDAVDVRNLDPDSKDPPRRRFGDPNVP